MTIDKANLFDRIKDIIGWSWKFFAGGVVVILGVYAQFYDLHGSQLDVEITQIQQISSAEIDPAISPEFANFRKIYGEDDFLLRDRSDVKYSISDLQKAIDRQKLVISDERQRLQKQKDLIDTSNESSIFNSRLRSYREYTSSKGGKEESESDFRARIKKESLDEIKFGLNRLDTRETTLSLAEKEVIAFKDKAEKNDAKIIVTAAVSNSGDASISLKPQSILRTDLGQGNYLDIYLNIKDYDKGVADIKQRSTAVIKFQSNPLGEMSPDDRARFLSFFKNTSPTKLYVVDVKNRYYSSNTIPFAQGIYEQNIFDGLKAFASKHGVKK